MFDTSGNLQGELHTPVIYWKQVSSSVWRRLQLHSDAPLTSNRSRDAATIQNRGYRTTAVPVNSQDVTGRASSLRVQIFRLPPASRVEFTSVNVARLHR